MRAMIATDLVTMKNALLQLGISCAVVAVVIAVMMQSLVASLAAICAMIPFMYLFSISAYDEMNGWERFRLTLPISRKQVAYGRYVSTLIVVIACCLIAVLFAVVVMAVMEALPTDMQQPALMATENPPAVVFGVCVRVGALILFVAALSLPPMMRFGMTKGSQLAPVVLIMLFAFGIWLTADNVLLDAELPGGLGTMNELFAHANGPSIPITLIIIAVALIAFVISALISAKLYERRQF